MDSNLKAQIHCREEALTALKSILITKLHLPLTPDTIDNDAPLFGTGLCLDSVDALELVVATEASFQIALPENALRTSMRTLNSLVDLVVRLQEPAT